MPELINTEYPVYLDESEQEKYEGLKKELIFLLQSMRLLQPMQHPL